MGTDARMGGILLLDEFNASVDVQTDKLMQAVMRKEFANFTIICVAHRLNGVLEFDRIMVLDKGEIFEMGSPKELLRRPGSRFRELWHAGNGDYEEEDAIPFVQDLEKP